jgi:hypothetical protein
MLDAKPGNAEDAERTFGRRHALTMSGPVMQLSHKPAKAVI